MPSVKYSFIFPVHNEAPYLVEQLKLFLHQIIPLYQIDFEILLIENGSHDQSARLAHQLAKKFSFIRSYSLAEASYGRAIMEGIRQARAEKVFVLNVDYFDIEFIQKAAHLLSYLDIVIGSKTLSRSHDQRPLARRLMTYFFNVFLRLVLNYPGTDTHGIKAFRRTPHLLEAMYKCRTKNELFDTELVLRLTHEGAIFVDLPQEVTEVRPTRYIGLRRLKSTANDLFQALLSKYVFKHQFTPDQVDADDYGISDQVNQAILHEVAHGRVHIVSVMANLVNPTAAKQLRTTTPRPLFSLHFNLLRGKPVAPVHLVSSLTNHQGKFQPLPIFCTKLLLGMVDPTEIAIEFNAQYHRLRKLGITPTMLNSEQHIHLLSPINRVLEAAIAETTITHIRSVASTHHYLRKKPFRFTILKLLLAAFGARFRYFSEFEDAYDAMIVHPGTKYD